MPYVDNSQITPLYANTTPGLIADASVIDPAIAAMIVAINTNFDLFTNFIGSIELPIPDQSIVTRHLRNLAVTNPKLAPLAVTADKIADGTITTAKLMDMVITAQKIASNAILERHLSNSSVSRRTIVPGAVGANEIDPTIVKPISDAAVQIKFNQIDEQLEDTTLNANGRGINILFPPPPLVACKGDGTDDTIALQNIATLGRPIIIPRTTNGYLITGSIVVTNSVIGIGLPTITITGGNGDGARRMFIAQNAASLDICGLRLVGNYDGTGNTGEQDHLIRIVSSSDVRVYNNILENAYGDCVYIGRDNFSSVTSASKRIYVYNNLMSNPRRCAVAVVHAETVVIKENTIIDSFGYVGSIDLEPNPNSIDYVRDVIIEDNSFNSALYFVNLYNPNISETQTITDIIIKKNTGISTFLFRVANQANANNVLVSENTFYGSGRMFSVVVPINPLVIDNNKDFSTGALGWGISNQNSLSATNNYIESSRTNAAVFTNCQYVDFKNNTIKKIHSGTGSLRFLGANEQKGHKITGNTILGSRYALLFDGSIYSSVLISGNTIESDERAIVFTAAIAGSDITVTDDNIYIGAGVSQTGLTYIQKNFSAKQQNKDITITYGSSMPVSGSYHAGSIHFNTGTTKDANNMHIIGWRRVTTGSTHTLNTDWYAMYVSTVSPAN